MALVGLILCTILVTLLLHIERRRNREASLALWVPTVWMLIYASRPLGQWFGGSSSYEGGVEAGSPLDRMVLGTLIALALLILYRRKTDCLWILKDNFWLILAFLYMGISIIWSDIPFVSLKRWVRSDGDILMALVILSEGNPLAALESILRRCAYVLVPFSLVLVKYFPALGRAYSWSGGEMWTGVADYKNGLGELCALSAFVIIWALLREWKSGNLFRMRSQTFADIFVLAIAAFLLRGPGVSYSATAVGSLLLGIAILFVLYRRENVATYVARHLKALATCLVLTSVVCYGLFMPLLTPLLGRDETLTSRTEIWTPVLDFASRSPIIGVGYGGLYAPGNPEMVKIFGPRFIMAQAHSGYLAVYVELGMIGIVLLAAFLLSYCGRATRQLYDSFDWGAFGICLLPMSLIYNITEVSFLQSSNYLWSTMVCLTVVFSASSISTTQT